MSLPSVMDSWQVSALGEPGSVMRREKLPVPEPDSGQVVVQVWSASLTYADAVRVRSGVKGQPLALPFTPGRQVCGEIVSVGEGVHRTRLGERVIATVGLPRGGLAGYALTEADDCLPAPPALDDASAAAFGVPYQTAWLSLYRRANLKVTQSLVVYGATGDVGSAAVQLGKGAGAKVVAVVTGAQQARQAGDLGADVVVDRLDLRGSRVGEVVRQVTGGRGADVVLVAGEAQGMAGDNDMVGFVPQGEIGSVVAFEGLVVVTAPIPAGLSGGVDALAGGYGLLGIDRDRYRMVEPAVLVRAHDQLTSLAAARVVNPLVSARMDFDDAPKALTALADGRAMGSIAIAAP